MYGFKTNWSHRCGGNFVAFNFRCVTFFVSSSIVWRSSVPVVTAPWCLQSRLAWLWVHRFAGTLDKTKTEATFFLIVSSSFCRSFNQTKHFKSRLRFWKPKVASRLNHRFAGYLSPQKVAFPDREVVVLPKLCQNEQRHFLDRGDVLLRKPCQQKREFSWLWSRRFSGTLSKEVTYFSSWEHHFAGTLSTTTKVTFSRLWSHRFAAVLNFIFSTRFIRSDRLVISASCVGPVNVTMLCSWIQIIIHNLIGTIFPPT